MLYEKDPNNPNIWTLEAQNKYEKRMLERLSGCFPPLNELGNEYDGDGEIVLNDSGEYEFVPTAPLLHLPN